MTIMDRYHGCGVGINRMMQHLYFEKVLTLGELQEMTSDEIIIAYSRVMFG